MLPYILPVGHKVDMWKIVKNFIGTDLSKVCLPVAMCEPVNTLQKSAEVLVNYSLLQKAIQ